MRARIDGADGRAGSQAPRCLRLQARADSQPDSVQHSHTQRVLDHQMDIVVSSIVPVSGLHLVFYHHHATVDWVPQVGRDPLL